MSGFTPEQLEARRATLGASELPAILGISPYKGAFEVWLEKRGLAAPRADDTPWQRWGLKMEPVLAEAYTDYMLQTHGRTVILTGDGRTPVQLTGTPWSCTPDRRCLLFGGHIDEMWGVDFKQTRYGDGYGLSGTDEVPAHVFAQMQWSMYVTGSDNWDVAALIGGSDFRVYHLSKDSDFIEHAVQAARDFWTHVESGTEPPIDGSAAAKHYLRVKFPTERVVDALPVYDDAATLALFQELRLVHADAKRAEERQAALENQVKLLIGDRPGILTPLGRATWKKTKDSTRIDWEALARDVLGDKVGAYIPKYSSVAVGARRFLFSPTIATKETAE